MTTDLATTDLGSTPFTWKTLVAIADTEMVPKRLRGNPPAMLAAVYMGRELGLGPMQSMQMIDVIDGRPSLSAELQTAMIRDAGHSMLCAEMSDRLVTIDGTRRDNGDKMSITFTAEMATRAGLAGKRNWQQYPEAMLWARAVSMLARMLFADVFAAMHVYTPDELGDASYAPSAHTPGASETPQGVVVDLDTRTTESDDEGATGTVITVPEALDHNEDTLEAHREILEDDRSERGHLEARLVELLAERPDAGSMSDVETRLRAMCRIGERLGILHGRADNDFLHSALSDVGAGHMSDLKRVELDRLATSLRHEISDRFTMAIAETNLAAAGLIDLAAVSDETPEGPAQG